MLVSAIGKFNAAKNMNNTINKNTFNGDKTLETQERNTPLYEVKSEEMNNKSSVKNNPKLNLVG